MKYRIDADSSLTRRVKETATEALSMSSQTTNNDEPDFYGFHPIPAGGAPVTNKLVNDLRQESGI